MKHTSRGSLIQCCNRSEWLHQSCLAINDSVYIEMTTNLGSALLARLLHYSLYSVLLMFIYWPNGCKSMHIGKEVQRFQG